MAALTQHGGRVDAAALAFPDAPLPWLDLSTGINPNPWQATSHLLPALDRLPTASELAALERAAAACFGAPPEQVMATPGSEIALRQLGQILPGPHHHLAPGYRTHAEAFEGSSALARAEDWAGTGTLTFANPANPTGTCLSPDRVRALAGKGWLIVDEAFADCTPDASIAPALPPRTVVLRSFGKFFGLAGVRLGFVIGPADILARLRRLLGDWPVSAPAIAYGTAAYGDTRWIAVTRQALREQAVALDAMLARHALAARGDCPLFRLVDTDRPIFEHLARAGILTRPFDYDPCWVRIGLPRDAKALARLDQALAGG